MTHMTTDTDDTTQLEILTKLPPKPKEMRRANKTELALIAGGELANTIPFSSIKLSTNIRSTPTKGLVELAESIRTTGLQQPLGIRLQEGEPILETGHRRYLALRAMGLKDDPVPVHVVSSVDPTTRSIRQHAENTNRVPLSPMDEARLIEDLITHREMTVQAVASHLGLDRKTVTSRRCLLHLPDKAQAQVENGTWAVEAAQEVGRLIKQGHPQPDQLIGRHMVSVERAALEWKSTRLLQSLTSNLEARGVKVVTNARLGPAPEGQRTELGERLEVATVKDVKALDVAKLGTVTDEEGTPVLTVQPGYVPGNPPVVWTLQLVDKGSKATETSPHRQVESLVDANHETRVEEVKALIKQQGLNVLEASQMWRFALHMLVSRTWGIDLKLVAEIGGVDLGDAPASQQGEVARVWLADPRVDEDTAKVMVMAIVLLAGCRDLKYLDGKNEVDTPGELGQALLDLGVTGLSTKEDLLASDPAGSE